MVARGLQKFLPDLSAALVRFPVAAFVSLFLCLALNVQIWIDESKDTADIISAGAAGFLAGGAAHLFAEGRCWTRSAAIVFALLAAVSLASVGYFTSFFNTSYLFLFPGLIVTVMIAGHLRKNIEQGAIWLFNLRLGIAALLAGIVAGLFAAGLSAIVEALNFLFDVGLTSQWHSHIWATAFSLIAPLYGLSLMPQNLDEQVQLTDQNNTLIERGVSVLVNYVLVPIAIVYALILHAYAVKIILQGGLPKGQIGTMVTIFALGGTGAWLVAWPWRDTGTKLLRLFMRGWFWLTIVPAALLIIAIWRRIADYGVTPDRYGLVLTAIWLAAIAIYLALRRNQADTRAILGGIAVLLLVGAAGPSGAYGLSNSSQLARLTKLMEANGLLKDGKAVPPPPKFEVNTKVKREGHSILSALHKTGGLEQLKPWFAEPVRDALFETGSKSWATLHNISKATGLDYDYVPPDTVRFDARRLAEVNLPVSGRLLGPLEVNELGVSLERVGQPPEAMVAEISRQELKISYSERSWLVPIQQILDATNRNDSVNSLTGEPIVLDVAADLTLIITDASGELGDSPRLSRITMWAIVKPP